MEGRFSPLLALCLAMPLLASCLGNDDDEVMSYDDAAITGFSVKPLKRLMHTTSKSGADSTYTTKFDAGEYRFCIDQIRKEIYNPDSLPVGVDASKVVSTITTKNAGLLAIKSANSDSVKYFNSADSVDFTKPRQIIVYNNAGTGMNTYTVRVNVHRETAGVFRWSNPVGSDARLGALTAMKALAMGDRLYVFGDLGGGTKIYAAPRSNGTQWEEVTPSLPLSAGFCHNVVVLGNMFLAYNAGKVIMSADARTWQTVAAADIRQLLGASTTKLYALTADGRIVASADRGATWTADRLDAPAARLPQADLNFVVQPLTTNVGASRLLVSGTTDRDASLWGKIEENDSKAENQPWTYYTPSPGNRYALPNLSHLQMVRYGDALVAIGGAGQGNSAGTGAFTQVYASRDGGLTWKKHGAIAFPPGFDSSPVSFALATDADNYLWVVCGKTGQVWKGRLNELGWTEARTSFTE